jgi:hypothetical protein
MFLKAKADQTVESGDWAARNQSRIYIRGLAVKTGKSVKKYIAWDLLRSKAEYSFKSSIRLTWMHHVLLTAEHHELIHVTYTFGQMYTLQVLLEPGICSIKCLYNPGSDLGVAGITSDGPTMFHALEELQARPSY